MENGTIIQGKIITEGTDKMILQTQIGQLQIDKAYITALSNGAYGGKILGAGGGGFLYLIAPKQKHQKI